MVQELGREREMSVKLHVRELSRDLDPVPTLTELVQSSGLLDNIKTGDKVLIKPNYVAPFPMATTDSRFLEFFILALKDKGATPVVGEMSGYEFDTTDTVTILGILPLLKRLGVAFVNFEQASYVPLELDTGMIVNVAEISQEADYIINLPVLKGHTITKITGAVKNFFGLLDRDSRRHLHCQKIHSGIASLARAYPNTIHCVDARTLLTRAVFGKLLPLDVCMMGANPFALGHFGSKLLGVNPDAVLHLEKIPEYDIEGFVPVKRNNELSDRSSLKERLHRMVYSLFYYIDEFKCSTLGGSSIIPELHWHLGVHPDVSNVDENRITVISALCPIDAIDIGKKTIIKARCMKVRCLNCYTNDPTGQVALKGLNPPTKWK